MQNISRKSCNARCFSAVNESCNAEKRRKLRFSIVLEKPMLRFYDVDENFVRYLQSVDRQIPNVSSSANSKFVCGIVLRINGIDYYAPISSITQTQRTNLPIIDKKRKVLATVRFSFMFPALSAHRSTCFPIQSKTPGECFLSSGHPPPTRDRLLRENGICPKPSSGQEQYIPSHY